MEYYEQIVKNRNSCRRFADREVEPDVLVAIQQYYEDEDNYLVEDLPTELRLFKGDVFRLLDKNVGYNGYCVKAPAYMLLFSDEEEHYLENAGFIAQGITLKMTELGLAACWMTINNADAAKAELKIDTDKKLACVVAFGYRAADNDEKKAVKKTLDDMTDGKKFGKDIDTDMFYPELEDALRAVAHAQSFANRQPYRIIVDDDMVFLIGLPDDDTNFYDTHLNYGIAMFNFYAVLSAARPSAPKWSFEEPDRDLGLKDGAVYVAKCRV